MQHRTALITAGSIVGVVIAGVSAIAAGMGILDSSSTSNVGELSAAAPAPQVIDVYVTDPTQPAQTTVTALVEPTVQQFTVEAAGIVSLRAEGNTISVDQVMPNAGWTWETRQSDPSSLVVSLTDGASTYELSASASDGVITAAASLLPPPQAATAGTAATAATSPSYDDDEYDDDEYEEYESEEHEGGEDDD